MKLIGIEGGFARPIEYSQSELDPYEEILELKEWKTNEKNGDKVSKIIVCCFMSKSPALSLSYMGLTTLPSCIFGKLQHVKHFDCWENDLKVIPPEIGNLTELEDFDCSKNRLEELPKEILNCTNLKTLVCYNNKFKEGGIPQELVARLGYHLIR